MTLSPAPSLGPWGSEYGGENEPPLTAPVEPPPTASGVSRGGGSHPATPRSPSERRERLVTPQSSGGVAAFSGAHRPTHSAAAPHAFGARNAEPTAGHGPPSASKGPPRSPASRPSSRPTLHHFRPPPPLHNVGPPLARQPSGAGLARPAPLSAATGPGRPDLTLSGSRTGRYRDQKAGAALLALSEREKPPPSPPPLRPAAPSPSPAERRVAGGGSPPPARHFAPVAALPRPPRAALKVDLAIDHRAYLGAMGRTPAPSSAGPSTMHPASYAPPAPHRPLTYDAALGPARVVHVHTWEDDYTESSPVEVMLRQLRMRGLLHPPKQKEAPPGGRPIGAISVPLAKVHAARVRWVGWPLTYAPMDGWMDGLPRIVLTGVRCHCVCVSAGSRE